MDKYSISNVKRAQDTDVMKVILFASVIIICSIILVGILVYGITERAAVDKLKSKDLIYIAQSISSKIDGRIKQAQEAALILAKDPEMLQWVADGEKKELQPHALQRLQEFTKLGYSNSFVVSAITYHYWAENGTIIDTVSPQDPDDDWFFETLAAKQPVSQVIDYNGKRHDTFVFVNALMGDPEKPLAITGVGLSLQELSQDFQSFKYGEKSDLWLIDKEGNIYLSDNPQHNGQHIKKFLPEQVIRPLLASGTKTTTQEYRNNEGNLLDIIRYPLKSAQWQVLIQIPREETVSYLKTIKYNTLLGNLIAIIAITFLFNFVSRNLADPYKKALQLNQELEDQVSARTKELHEKNQKLMDSIDYAQRIQQSLLPSQEKLRTLFKDYFLLWQPRDVVGGDFYWTKQFGKDFLVALGDCTGHGVPGALMSSLSISILNQIADDQSKADPALILQRLNRLIKQTLQQDNKAPLTDDGLDIGLCYYNGQDQLIFAGAKCPLYLKTAQGLQVVPGNKKSIGYVRTAIDYCYHNTCLAINEGDVVTITTDGLLDQNGGPQDYCFGKKRFCDLLQRCSNLKFAEQRAIFQKELASYMDDQPQRDDITVLAFQIK